MLLLAVAIAGLVFLGFSDWMPHHEGCERALENARRLVDSRRELARTAALADQLEREADEELADALADRIVAQLRANARGRER